MSTQLIELSNALAQATERAAACTVAVHAEARGSSSGIVWRPGVIVTADHALRRDEEISITLPGGRVVSAALVGRDPSTDIAVLKCAETVAAVTNFADVTKLKAGSLTLVVGQTRASGPVAALGVISLLAAERRGWTGSSLAPYIRLDVGVQPTASGGLVVDADGRAIGMATPRFARFGAIAVPTPTINRAVDALLASGRIPHGYLGVGLQPIRLPEALRQSLHRDQKTAVIVLEVEPDGPAGKAGIVIGDILVELSGAPVSRLEDVQAHLQGDAIGKPLAAKIVRGGVSQNVTVTVGERAHGGSPHEGTHGGE